MRRRKNAEKLLRDEKKEKNSLRNKLKWKAIKIRVFLLNSHNPVCDYNYFPSDGHEEENG
jgi:hypothetical protein